MISLPLFASPHAALGSAVHLAALFPACAVWTKGDTFEGFSCYCDKAVTNQKKCLQDLPSASWLCHSKTIVCQIALLTI